MSRTLAKRVKLIAAAAVAVFLATVITAGPATAIGTSMEKAGSN